VIAAEDVDAAAHARSIASYFAAFAPVPTWDELASWPPDIFALANLVLDHTESYRFVVAPPRERRWPPLPDWHEQVRAAAAAWREGAALTGGAELPRLVARLWDTVTRCRDVSLAEVRSGKAWELTAALLTLHAVADEACSDVSAAGRRAPSSAFDRQAWRLLQERGSLSRLSATRVRIVPKTQFSARGITIRSLSRYLALCYESVDVRWRSAGPGPGGRTDYNIVLLPWPLVIDASDFKPAPSTVVENMDSSLFGFFEFAPRAELDCETVGSVLESAAALAGCVDAVILPESAVTPAAIPELERALARQDATFLIAGVRELPTASAFGRNYLHFGIRTAAGWKRYEQDKHHRWCLDEPQIRQYHLSRSLDPKKRWWEAIDIRERTLHIIDVGDRITTAPMVCEDLARLDEVTDLVRRIGPSLVVAVLLDGPQLSKRWPCRYASVLADDPGSAVLTLTAYGMAARSRPAGKPRSRVIAHWNSQADGVHEIELARGASGVLLQTSIEGPTLWTADGRSHHEVPRLELRAVSELRPRRPAR
jgi:hypothetical protein